MGLQIKFEPQETIKRNFRMSIKWNTFAISGFAALLMACQPEARLTSINPLLQSEESRALREAFSGLSLQFKPEESPGYKDCVVTVTFYKNGNHRRETRCKTVVALDKTWRRMGATGGIQVADGSWTVRDEEICYNFFSFDGVPSPDANDEAKCFPASISGNQAVIAGTRSTVVARGL